MALLSESRGLRRPGASLLKRGSTSKAPNSVTTSLSKVDSPSLSPVTTNASAGTSTVKSPSVKEKDLPPVPTPSLLAPGDTFISVSPVSPQSSSSNTFRRPARTSSLTPASESRSSGVRSPDSSVPSSAPKPAVQRKPVPESASTPAPKLAPQPELEEEPKREANHHNNNTTLPQPFIETRQENGGLPERKQPPPRQRDSRQPPPLSLRQHRPQPQPQLQPPVITTTDSDSTQQDRASTDTRSQSDGADAPSTPHGPWTPPMPDPLVVAPLTTAHYECYQSHRSMPAANNYWCATPCMTCRKMDQEIRHRCVFCSLRICADCFEELQKVPSRSLRVMMAEY
ncbi:hypothetical protein VTN31DRAFT_3656 [Thermomyces dupontii]|uniref:uncharacterized protein n=1 Tax=Talaromyces thermophilus TaxID=28565 RepID=UPI003742F4BB